MAGVLGRLVAEVARRHVARTVIAYSMASFGFLQGADIVVARLGLPSRWMQAAVVLVLAGFPLTAVLAWIFDVTPDGVVRTTSPGARRDATLVQALLLGAALALAFGVGWLAWRDVSAPEPERAPASAADEPLDVALRDLLRRFRVDNPQVPPWFRDRVRAQVEKLLADAGSRREVYPRMKRFWPMVSQKLGERGLPEELGYIAWVESSFDPAHRGPGPEGSSGLWGFSEGTARLYGLRVDAEVDERNDPVLASDAAARYLAKLFAEFGVESFMLAVASYNMGENKLRRKLVELAERPGGLRPEDRTFWQLYKMQALPEETMEYVPHVLAVAIICADPGRYGLE